MSAVHFLANELGKWDAAEADAVVISFFADERPLRGAAGLVDWRLGGRLSRLLKAGRLSGAAGETTMLPPARGRLTFPRVMLFGLGDSSGFDETRCRDAIRRIRSVVARAGIKRYAVQPPGRATGLIAPRRALELWLDEAAKAPDEVEVTLIESPSGQKEMAEAMRAKR